ncbi:hypothetical protein RN001_013838 [Aquatica leii]|uniref:phytanoyl-CoA dioxygenase n=1 Tax=Aquatica leii TaxID=1421715 RepID=A0AAN7P3C2_9COLE|nr:hypothetical protein RN001_013838 [Aquatica leii]
MFQYTKNGNFLTENQRKFYEDNGFLVIPKLVDNHLLENCRSKFAEVCNKGPSSMDMMVMKELSLKHQNFKGEYLVNKIQNLMNDEVFFACGSYKPLVDVVESIIGPSITCCQSMLINKPPGAEPKSSQHAMHQDYYYFPFGPVNSIVTVWAAIDSSNVENGCLFVLPGTHKNNLLPHKNGKGTKNVGYYEIVNYNKVNLCHLIMEQGDTVFLHPLLAHGSGANLTKNFRKAISCFYIDSNSYLIDFKGTQQEDLEKVMFKAYNKQHSHLKNYLDSWRLSSRLIRGSPGVYQQCLSQL